MNDTNRDPGPSGSPVMRGPAPSPATSHPYAPSPRFFKRLRRRLERAGEVVCILVIDAVVVSIGFGIVLAVEEFVGDGNALFDVVKAISHGSFLLIYVLWVGVDLWDFWRECSDEGDR